MHNNSSPCGAKSIPEMGFQAGLTDMASVVLTKQQVNVSKAEMNQRILAGKNKALSPPSHQRDQVSISVHVLEANPLAAEHLLRILSKDSQFAVKILKNAFSQAPAQHRRQVLVISQAGISSPLPVFITRLKQSFPDSDLVFVGELAFWRELQQLPLSKRVGFVSYLNVEKKLLSTVRIVASRISPRSAVLYRSGLARDASQHATSWRKMTRREAEILDLVLYRLSNKEIASVLNVSEATAKFHVSNILSKVGVDRRRNLLALLDDRHSAALEAGC
ncbi:MAG TPA: LuxR C-terminal-related transcriptional regulator [Candidatus Angelobacter sp.]|jgi:DNA-binding NarL/FixJ family response regulator|nr:LuxR C-terminal-related transcriptional regulator [Candidatus Angelobacter sp.]